MADIKKTIELLFLGTDQVSDKVETISGSMTGLKTGFDAIGKAGEIIEDIAAPFATLAKGVLGTEAALGAMAAGGLAYSITKAVEFESASADLNKVLGEESDRLKEAQDEALSLSSKYGKSTSEILQSMANFKQAGFDLSGSINLTNSALDLAIAGDLEAAEASDILVASLKGFKAPAEESARLTDILNEVSNNYATNVRELGIGMANLSPIANQMGFSFEETAGILTPVIEVFRSGDQAAVALKTGLLKLIDDSKPVQDALSAIGVSQKDANGALRSGKDILFDVANAFQGLDQNSKIYFASQLVGIHQAGKMVEVFDGLNKVTEVTKVAMGSAGSAANEVKIRLETAEVAVNRFKTGFENLGTAIGLEFLEATKSVIEGGISIEDTLRNIVKGDTLNPIFNMIRSLADEFGLFLEGIAAALPDAFDKVKFEGLLESLDNLKGSFKGIFQAIFGDLDLTKPDELAKAVQKVVDTITSLTNITAGIVERINPLLQLFSDWTAEVNKWDADSQRAAGNRLADALIIDKFGGIFGSILIAISGHAREVDQAMNEMNVLGDPFAGMSDGAGKAASAVGKIPPKIGELGLAVDDAAGKQIRFGEGIDKNVDQAEALKKKIHELTTTVKETPDSKEITVTAKADADSVLQARNYIEYELPDGRTVKEFIKVDSDSLDKTKKQVDEKLPAEKQMEIQAKIDIEKIKALAAVIQSSIEWKAKLDIAEVEADAAKFKAIIDSITEGIKSTGDVLGSLFDVYATADTFKSGNIESWIRKEYELREKEFSLQEGLTAAQIAYMNAKTDALYKGNALITIKGDGLAPHLQAFMDAVLSEIQVEATAEGADFLVGIS